MNLRDNRGLRSALIGMSSAARAGPTERPRARGASGGSSPCGQDRLREAQREKWLGEGARLSTLALLCGRSGALGGGRVKEIPISQIWKNPKRSDQRCCASEHQCAAARAEWLHQGDTLAGLRRLGLIGPGAFESIRLDWAAGIEFREPESLFELAEDLRTRMRQALVVYEFGTLEDGPGIG